MLPDTVKTEPFLISVLGIQLLAPLSPYHYPVSETPFPLEGVKVQVRDEVDLAVSRACPLAIH